LDAIVFSQEGGSQQRRRIGCQAMPDATSSVLDSHKAGKHKSAGTIVHRQGIDFPPPFPDL
jgi:hypothetical protein